jgi:glycosyltransferase involved in cell wall biosynthesis
MKKISIVTGCYNEEENVELLIEKVREVMQKLPEYTYEHIFIDNSSTDNTVNILKRIAKEDKKIKIIVNSRNFGPIRSPYYGLLQMTGDCVISLVADLQDPPELIYDFVKEWEKGEKIVIGVKKTSGGSKIMGAIRKLYYKFVRSISDIELIDNFTGFGLYDREIIEILKKIDDKNPYFRGLICEIGFDKKIIPYDQPKRHGGKSSYNLSRYFDYAMTGITSSSKAPIRIATVCGFFLSFISLLISFVYLILKLIFWNSMEMGMAPVLIGVFFFSAVQLFFIGLMGEYILVLVNRSANRPIVVEKERINFEEDVE